MVTNYGIPADKGAPGVLGGLGPVVDTVGRYLEAGATRVNIALADPVEEAWPALAAALTVEGAGPRSSFG